jgi:putative FmdB family regulatory protein
MPNYEFECKRCGVKYEEIASYDETGKYPGIKCPFCNSKSKKKLVSVCHCTFTNPVGTDLYESSHDYRYHHQINKSGGVREQRAVAEADSHVGPTPYNPIDDISGGKHFGKVK